MEQMVDLSAAGEIREHLAVTRQGTIKGTMQNYMIVLKEDPLLKGSLRYNLLNQRIDIVKILWWNDGICPMTDAGRTVAASIQYHPICEYLYKLEWVGTERIRYVLKRYMGADDSDMVYECLKHFMMEAMLRIF